jgi:glycogen debranching enzyme
MQEVVRLDEPYYIVADTERTSAPLRVLKKGDSFAVFDQHGDISPAQAGEGGLYHEGTRFLSRFELLLNRKRPLFLSSTISDDNAAFTANLTNFDVFRDERIVVPRGEIHLFRSRVLRNGVWLERIRVSNYGLVAVELPLVVTFEADFADVFEVRGTRRLARGERLPDVVGAERVLRYRGLDGVERRTRIRFSMPPHVHESGIASFKFELDPSASMTVDVTIRCEAGADERPLVPYDEARQLSKSEAAARRQRQPLIVSSNESFDRWVRRSTSDLHMMLTETPMGEYPYAGIPWFSTPFGRDGLITAFELLWADPAIARGVLEFLAGTQAVSYDETRDAQPGKILHEMRAGEMAALGEVPFARYYGTADATPLFVALAHAYVERTGDLEFIERLWPHVRAALDWMSSDGDPDGDGFIEYARQSATGLVQQGWKDSHDSIFHADGALAPPPIALCEVQAYAYAAWSGAARLAKRRGDQESAREWDARAKRLRERFDAAYWCHDLGTYAIALDGSKRPCRVRASNAGHCLYAGIAKPSRARTLAATLMSEASFAGWGLRTVAAGEARYNPMSYHNGSIWPHDTALAAAGLARYGFTAAATLIMAAIFDLSQAVDLCRLPELICGFHRRGDEHPTLYPVACAPQSWSAGAVYLLVQACLGLRVDAVERRVSFTRSTLPEGIEWIRVSNIVVGDASVDLRLERHPQDVSVTVLRRDGDVEVVSIK